MSAASNSTQFVPILAFTVSFNQNNCIFLIYLLRCLFVHVTYSLFMSSLRLLASQHLSHRLSPSLPLPSHSFLPLPMLHYLVNTYTLSHTLYRRSLCLPCVAYVYLKHPWISKYFYYMYHPLAFSAASCISSACLLELPEGEMYVDVYCVFDESVDDSSRSYAWKLIGVITIDGDTLHGLVI